MEPWSVHVVFQEATAEKHCSWWFFEDGSGVNFLPGEDTAARGRQWHGRTQHRDLAAFDWNNTSDFFFNSRDAFLYSSFRSKVILIGSHKSEKDLLSACCFNIVLRRTKGHFECFQISRILVSKRVSFSSLRCLPHSHCHSLDTCFEWQQISRPWTDKCDVSAEKTVSANQLNVRPLILKQCFVYRKYHDQGGCFCKELWEMWERGGR